MGAGPGRDALGRSSVNIHERRAGGRAPPPRLAGQPDPQSPPPAFVPFPPPARPAALWLARSFARSLARHTRAPPRAPWGPARPACPASRGWVECPGVAGKKRSLAPLCPQPTARSSGNKPSNGHAPERTGRGDPIGGHPAPRQRAPSKQASERASARPAGEETIGRTIGRCRRPRPAAPRQRHRSDLPRPAPGSRPSPREGLGRGGTAQRGRPPDSPLASPGRAGGRPPAIAR